MLQSFLKNNLALLLFRNQTQYSFAGGIPLYSIFFVNLSISPVSNLPNCTAFDYETITMPNCSLGKIVTFTRKKPSSICEPDPAILQNVTVQFCQCSLADYFCSSCYIPDSTTGQCTEILPNCLNQIIAICTPGNLYTYPTRYIKATSTECVTPPREYDSPQIGMCPLPYLDSAPIIFVPVLQPNDSPRIPVVQSPEESQPLAIIPSTQARNLSSEKPIETVQELMPVPSAMWLFYATAGSILAFVIFVVVLCLIFWKKKSTWKVHTIVSEESSTRRGKTDDIAMAEQ